MFRHILVPVDFSPRGRRAVRTAARLAASSGSDVTVLHVIERIADADERGLASFYRRLDRVARERMRSLVTGLRVSGGKVRAAIEYGKPVNEILRFAEDHDVDLIVMSSHRVALRPGQSWGTISYKVGVLSRCPVLLIK